MPRLWPVLAAALALAGCGHEADWPPPKPALWQVTGPGGQQGWLFGTIHSLPDGVEWHTQPVDQAFSQSSVLVVEIANLSDTDAAAAAFRKLSTTPGLPPLTERVPPADRPQVAAFLAKAGLDDGAFPATESWGAAMILANRVRAADSGNGVDRALIARARRVEGLETFESQYAVFDRLPPSAQAELLVGLAKDSASTSESAEERAWLTGDLAALQRQAATGVLAYPDLREPLQLARNRAWAARVAQLLADRERPFVAVGEAHMFGDESLPALLAARGYMVKRVE
ncbi:MAG: TraB/GumN family protein [Porphyrobacter sp.]|nr:TraB/GumN family protein [Porphyrobacter sp.]